MDRAELGGVASLDVGSDLGANAQPEPSGARVGKFPCNLGGDHWAARERHSDAGEDVEVAGQGHRSRGEIRSPVGLRDDQPGVS